MLRIRHLDGSVTMLPRTAVALEICSVEGGVGAVVVPKEDGRILVYEDGDPEFEPYCKAAGAQPVGVVIMQQNENSR